MNASAFSMTSDLARKTQMPFSRILGIYLIEAKYEALRMLRMPAFAICFLAIPVALYLFFGLVLYGEAFRHDPRSAIALFTGISVFGVVGPSLFGFGIFVAMDREQGLLKLKRALPMPPAAYLVAKMFMSLLFSVIIMITMVVAALFIVHLQLTAGQILRIALVSILGTLPFCAIGVFVATLVSGRAAPGVVNLIYHPMLHLSGILYQLPKGVLKFAPVWPTYRLMQLSYWASGTPYKGSALAHAAVLTGLTVVLVAFAIRRLERIG